MWCTASHAKQEPSIPLTLSAKQNQHMNHKISFIRIEKSPFSRYESQDVVLHKDYTYSCWVHGCLSSKTTKKKTQYLSLEKSCKVIPWADDIGVFKTCPLLHTLQSLANSLHKYTKKRNSQNTSFFSRLNLQHLKTCVCIKHKAPTYSHFQKEQAYTHDWCQFPLVYELPV
jgi:uncharacterized protein YjaG (DUF416 family)